MKTEYVENPDLSTEAGLREIARAGEINEYLRSLGFLYVTMDLGGYRMGSMNKTLEL